MNGCHIVKYTIKHTHTHTHTHGEQSRSYRDMNYADKLSEYGSSACHSGVSDGSLLLADTLIQGGI